LSVVVFEKITGVRRWSEDLQAKGESVGFVPTMGALHQGHISLINRAKEVCDHVVVSIFVNPTQFNNSEDLANYPRTYDHDIELLKSVGCDALFYPSIPEMYPKPEKKHWDFGLLTTSLEGFYRPGHFDGMLTIVQKLLEIVVPKQAFFGEKDFQQLALIRKMVEVESLPVEIVGCPIVREHDGLAMSSRNVRLNESQRNEALAISKTLFQIQRESSFKEPRELAIRGMELLSNAPGIRPEYFALVNASTFEPLSTWPDEDDAVALVAVYVGEIRLIDNIVIKKKQ
jgi:pantoate--beta-alanine ligase